GQETLPAEPLDRGPQATASRARRAGWGTRKGEKEGEPGAESPDSERVSQSPFPTTLSENVCSLGSRGFLRGVRPGPLTSPSGARGRRGPGRIRTRPRPAGRGRSSNPAKPAFSSTYPHRTSG